MFYSLTGKIVHIEENGVALDCNGVAFYLSTTSNTLFSLDPVFIINANNSSLLKLLIPNSIAFSRGSIFHILDE